MNNIWSTVVDALPGGLELLGKVVGGPVGLLADGAGSLMAHALGTDATPDAVLTAMKADPNAAEKLAELQLNTQTQLQQGAMQQTLALAQEETKRQQSEDNLTESTNTAIVGDVMNARDDAKGNQKVYDVGLFILASFLVAMIAVLWGCWHLISGEMVIKPEAAGMFAAVTGLVGSIVGYFASNAQTVINFLFGGSLGGRKTSDALTDSVHTMGTALGKAANAPN